MERSLFVILLGLLVAGLAINYNSKYSTEVFAFRSVFNGLVYFNKYFGMKEGDPTTQMYGVTTQNWKHLSVEAQTYFNLIRFNNAKKVNDPVILRQNVNLNMAPPISLYNVLEKEEVSSLRNSKFVKLRDSFYLDFGKSKTAKTMLLIHGGGGFAGVHDGLQIRSIVEFMSNRLNSSLLNILSVNYRKMPLTDVEKKDNKNFASSFSEQVNDALEAYKWLINEKNVNAKDIVIMGDSFGAGIASSLLLRIAEDQQLDMPSSAILISGVYDLSGQMAASTMNEKNNLLCTRELLAVMEKLYKTETNLSPLNTWKNANKRVHSTKLLAVHSKDEEFTAESVKFLEVLNEIEHPSVKVIVDEMMPHIYPLLSYYIPEARATMQRIIDFIDE